MPRKNQSKRPHNNMTKWKQFQEWLGWRIFERKINHQDNLEYEADKIEQAQGKYN